MYFVIPTVDFPADDKTLRQLPEEWAKLDAEVQAAREKADAEDQEKQRQHRPGWVRPYDDDRVVAQLFVRLLKHKQAASAWQIGVEKPAELLKEAEEHKERGVKLFKQKRFERARHCFKRALSFSTALSNAADDLCVKVFIQFLLSYDFFFCVKCIFFKLSTIRILFNMLITNTYVCSF